MNIPVFSYIFLRGKCAYCKEKINLIYLIIELLTGFLFVLAYLFFGFEEEFFLLIILSSIFVVTIVSDFIYYYISDRVLLLGIILILITKYIFGDIFTALNSLLSGLIMFLLMLLIKLIGDKIFKKESLGGGDIKLMGVIGSAIGVIPAMFSIMLGSMIAIPFALISLKNKENGIVPYGPFLIVAAIILIYFKFPFNNFLNLIGL